MQAVIADIYAGRPVGYSTFLAYDEVAHHSGVERSDTLSVLRRVDRQIGRIAAAARDAPRPYRFVVLSDHGQSQGETFLDRYGISLEELVERACDAEDVRAEERDERSPELPRTPRSPRLRRPTPHVGGPSGRGSATAWTGGTARRGAAGPDSDVELPELSVMASGCLDWSTSRASRAA